MFNAATSTQKPKGNNSTPRVDHGPVPQGQHVGRIVRVVGFGLQETANQFNPDSPPATVFQVTVELPHETIVDKDKDGNEVERPRWIWSKDIPIKFFEDYKTGKTLAHEKSKLNELFTACFGPQEWTPDNVSQFFDKLIGTEVSVFVTHSQSKKTGKTYDNIKQFLPVMKGMQVPELQNDTLFYNPYAHDAEAFEKLPQHSKERINNRLDAQQQQQAQPEPQPQAQPTPDFDDDTPF